VFQVEGGVCFLEVEDVLALHRDQVNATGEPIEILFPDRLDSCIASVQNAYWYGVTDHFQLSVKYAFGIAKAHAFFQGNKRTGLAASLTFLAAQSHDVRRYSNAVLVACMYGIVEDFVSTEEFASYLSRPSLPISLSIIIKRRKHETRKLISNLRQRR
jgi:death on curing protein